MPDTNQSQQKNRTASLLDVIGLPKSNNFAMLKNSAMAPF